MRTTRTTRLGRVISLVKSEPGISRQMGGGVGGLGLKLELFSFVSVTV